MLCHVKTKHNFTQLLQASIFNGLQYKYDNTIMPADVGMMKASLVLKLNLDTF